jgi:uncharacterized protein (TIGR01777 family)
LIEIITYPVTKNILITGASGIIGGRLTELLYEKGHRVAHLSRSRRSGKATTFLWDHSKNKMDNEALQAADAIIHLAGEGIAEKPWTETRKQQIIKSRTESTRLLYEELKKNNHPVKTFVSASAIGYYGTADASKLFTENENHGPDFLADVVRQWENAVDQISTLGIRVVKIRTGIVLSERGGALKELIKPIKFYVGSPLGSGDQMMSWIHLDDLCRIFIKAIEDQTLQGAYNGVAPHPVTNKEFTKSVGSVLHKPIILPAIPSFVLKFLMGEMADMVLKGAKISSMKIQNAGFEFKFKKLDDALHDLLD